MPSSKPSLRTVLAVLFLAAAAPLAVAQTYLDLENDVHSFTLDNGITFLVVERPEVPVFSFHTYVRVGSANEVRGITGIAHILEHMAFKGTHDIGTTDPKAEAKAMAAEDVAFNALKEERMKGALADTAKIAQLTKAFDATKDAARQYVKSNEFGEIVEGNGGVDMNALDLGRPDGLLLQHAEQPTRAVGLPRGRSHERSRDARVLHGEGRAGDRGTPHAHG